MTDWQDFRDWMTRADVQAAVARYEDDEEEPQPEQLAMGLDAEMSGREGA